LEYVVETENLVKVYPGDVKALDGVSLRVPKGVVFGLFGHNGAGKTTLLSILVGLVKPTSGLARVLGLDVLKESVEIRRRTSVMPEGYGFYEDMSGLANLVFLARLEGFDKEEARERAREAIKLVGLEDVAGKKVKSYSRGMKQRLCLAQAFLKDSDLYLLDEPTAGLDPEGASMFKELITSLVKQGKTVIISTHLLQEVGGICSHAAIIRRGKILSQGEFGEIAERVRRVKGYIYEVSAEGALDKFAKLLRKEDWVSETTVVGRKRIVKVVTSREAGGDIMELAGRAGMKVLYIKLLPSNWSEIFQALHE